MAEERVAGPGGEGARERPARAVAQAWVELVAEDPEAVSALAVARARLAAGHALVTLRRARVFELSGVLPAREEIADLLHRSTQFYNPHKERCTLRLEASEPAPLGADERAVLVTERGGERRPAAERWWRHQTGSRIPVKEGVAWVLGFAAGEETDARAAELGAARDRAHGLLFNPHAQDGRVAGPAVPLPWIGARRRTPGRAKGAP